MTVAIPAEATTFRPEAKLITVAAAPTPTPLSCTLTPVPAAVTFRRLEPSIAGSAPVSAAAGELVKLAADHQKDAAYRT